MFKLSKHYFVTTEVRSLSFRYLPTGQETPHLAQAELGLRLPTPFQRQLHPQLVNRAAFRRNISTSTMATPGEQCPSESQPAVGPAPPPPQQAADIEKPLPKLSPAEYRLYNRMAEGMDYYHNHFRSVWNTLMTACEKQKRPSGMSIGQFLSLGEQFVSGLTMHHGIEERHMFPLLGKKMPAFSNEVELLAQHKQIHKGLDKLDDFFSACRSGEKDFRLSELKEIMDSFGAVLWQHLDDEVAQLGAENMRKYWTPEEMRRMPM